MPSWLRCILVGLLLTISRTAMAAYVPPPIAGHVTDAAGKLAPPEIAQLNTKLADYRRCSGNHIAVFYPSSLEGYSVEDVAYVTFNTWKIGEAKKDNGVLLVLAPNERKIRIETGKGVGGELTDVESAHILREVVGPNMKAERFFAAADQATTRIGKALGGCAIADVGAPVATTPPVREPYTAPPPAKEPDVFGVMAPLVAMVFLMLVLAGFGLRGSWQTVLFVSFVLSGLFYGFGTAIAGGPFSGFKAEDAYAAFFFAAIALVIANIIIWVRRGRGIHGGSTEGWSVGSSDSSYDASSASSFSSWSSSSSDSSYSSGSSSDYSGGGGSSGGGGASDSY